MTNNNDDNIKRAMKTNHRSSGDGAGMDRSVYVDDGADARHGRSATGTANKTAKGWVIAALVVAVIVLVLVAKLPAWLDGVGG
jgi:hypothetical protein